MLTLILSLTSIAAPEAPLQKPSPSQLNEHWYRGEAEITSYELKQSRYGEVHEGHAVLVFVTEPFSKSKQVKVDRPAGGDTEKILKLNFTRKFNTGVYPYSMMTSTFSPIDGGPPLKSTTTSQEWCGHTFLQLNNRGKKFDVQSFSYFGSEGDQRTSVDRVPLEDELWTQIRVAPHALPTGSFQMIPGATYLRLRHVPLQPRPATGKLERKGDMFHYTIAYPTLGRTLTVFFEPKFPHRIDGWRETMAGGPQTNAKLKARIMSAYWNRNSNKDRKLRDTLGLP